MNSQSIGQFFFLLLTLTSPLTAEESSLSFADVQQVMESILDKHMGEKTLTPEIFEASIKLYIDQFDPERIYLLNQEVEEQQELAKDTSRKMVQRYQSADFSDYRRLEPLFANAIERNRKLRHKWYQRLDDLLALSNSSKGQILPSDESLAFAHSEQELNLRIGKDIAAFLRKAPQVDKAAFLDTYEKERRDAERLYLYQTGNGSILSEKEAEHLRALHLLKALTASLDAHSRFFDNNEAHEMKVRLEKGFNGIGISVAKNGEQFFISQMVPDSPAARSKKVRVGDQIIAINKQSVTGKSLATVLEKLRGHGQDKVLLKLQRQGESASQPIELSLKKEYIAVNEGRAKKQSIQTANGTIGIISLDTFYRGAKGVSSEEDVRRALDHLMRDGELDGLILDLRENSGGFLSEAVKVAGLFMTNGVVVVSKYSDGRARIHRDMDSRTSYSGPLVILTSRATASAAEIVAQALQDYGIALVVGDPQTYGKGTIQSQTITGEKNSSNFKVTVGKYYTVSGDSPQGDGVHADIVVPSPFDLLKIGESYLTDTKSNDTVAPSYDDKLEDIPSSLREWYLRYYEPTLQSPQVKWKALLPQLKARSAERIAAIPEFRSLKDQKKSGELPSTKEIDRLLHIQLEEAVKITEDMISLSRSGN